ncbi:Protein of unknown function [Cotesia congregata]|uniref:Uncharacterized protein n=1 Tax=Cotesia congregata TaxID=51543 RepID=A0A8J2H318_COTCN|nr:Protein of unknown function [Cotesia congregata]
MTASLTQTPQTFKKFEQIVLTVVDTETVKINTMLQVLEKIAKAKCLPILGCDEHKKELIAKILNNFVVTRNVQSTLSVFDSPVQDNSLYLTRPCP